MGENIYLTYEFE